MKYDQIDKLIGRSKALEFAGKDSDKDGVPNSLDCKPFDPKKQGVIHDIVEKYKKARSERRSDKEYERAVNKSIRKEAKEEYLAAKRTEEVRAAKERAKYDADKKLEYHKQGGFWGEVSRGVKVVRSNVSQTTGPSRRRKGSRSKRRSRTRSTYSQPPKKLDIIGKSFL